MLDATVIILAGGKGTRLAPYTTVFPKPMMPVGDLPILEIVLCQLRHYGFRNIVISVGHLAELLRAFFGDGSKWRPYGSVFRKGVESCGPTISYL